MIITDSVKKPIKTKSMKFFKIQNKWNKDTKNCLSIQKKSGCKIS
jgi:hypothetical protein